MTHQNDIILTGQLLTMSEEWDLAGFGSLLKQLHAEFSANDPVTRLIGYHGTASAGTTIRFFGVQVPEIGRIPDGMVSLAIGRNTLTVYEPLGTFNNVIWKSDLEWRWLDTSTVKYAIGEFTAAVPRAWLSGGNDTVRFVVSANSYSVRGQEKDDSVRLTEYDPAWPDRFESIKRWLRANIGPNLAPRIEHYGSTAIPGMTAKPVIDILMEITSFDEAGKVLLPLFNSTEYEYWWYNDHMLFFGRDRTTGIRTHHIHAAPSGHKVWEGLAFRDYMKTHPEDARKYEELKRHLAESHADDRETYTDLKESFVRTITDNAFEEQ